MSSFLSVLEAKTLAVHEALSWVRNMKLTHIVVEVDNRILFYALCNTDSSGLSYFASYIRDCKFLASQSCLFSLSGREDNIIAHTLARFVFMDEVTGVWFDDPPNCVTHLLN